jgi:hypothetical protein
MRTEAQIKERIEFVQLQIQLLKEMLNNRMVNKYDQNIYQVIYGYGDELNLLKWVLNEDQPNEQERKNITEG